ncbi:DUF3500 domain-containing protein [Oleiharenicola lentus]|jgi:hypothetical protein|uniref:DUF3500 domain-containing protein n=1 Tax=Oleiharenicola lentus TaxID=2508720 RepID=A0A4Q1C3P8_9BACT|nr:DUF3500 domain-containing protein [Oleiharenicola lentus]RXK52893.1 DUF3500 domain-containing protein [Oleiharenicola lentus]
MPHPTRLAALLLVTCLSVFGHEDHPPGEEMADAATAWLQSLDGTQRQAAVYPLADEERENWHFVPKARNGVPLKEMTPAQRKLARDLIAAGLSQRGLLTTDAIIALEDVLFAMEGTARRDRGLYHFTIFGAPDRLGTWGWRIEGHHLSVNFLIVEGTRISATPMFFGSNPAEVRIAHAHKGRRALAAEEDLGRALMLSFNPEQRSTALISTRAPADIITGNDRQALLAAPSGLSYAQMNHAQQAQLRALTEVYAGRLRAELAAAELQKIADRGWNKVHFAWAGGLERGDAHYYRIHSPDFVIEYDNTQNGANHIHTTWRDFRGDFGRDLLKEHHLESHAQDKAKH